MRRSIGVNLTELMVALLVIAIIAGLTIPQFLSRQHSKELEAKNSNTVQALQDSMSLVQAQMGLPPMSQGPQKLVQNRLNEETFTPSVPLSGVPEPCKTKVNNMDVTEEGNGRVKMKDGSFVYGLSDHFSEIPGANKQAGDYACVINEDLAKIVLIPRSGRISSVIASAAGVGKSKADITNTDSDPTTPTVDIDPSGQAHYSYPGIVYVTNFQDQPLAGVTVTSVSSSGGTQSGVTDAQGRFVLKRLPSGTSITVTIAKANYETRPSQTKVLNGVTPFTFPKFRRYYDITFTSVFDVGFPTGATLTGAVNDTIPQGQPKVIPILEGINYTVTASVPGHTAVSRNFNVGPDQTIPFVITYSTTKILTTFTWSNGGVAQGRNWFDWYRIDHGAQGLGIVYAMLDIARALGFSDAWVFEPVAPGYVNRIIDQSGNIRQDADCYYSGWTAYVNGVPTPISSSGPPSCIQNVGNSSPGRRVVMFPPGQDMNPNAAEEPLMEFTSPIKLSLIGESSKINSDDHFRLDVDGFKADDHPVITAAGGLNVHEAWLVVDRKGNGLVKNGVIDGDDVFGDHLGKFVSGYEDLANLFENQLKIDETGKRYLDLTPLNWFERFWIWLLRILGINRDFNPSYDLQLLTRDQKVLPASSVAARIYVDYRKVDEWDALKMNWIGQRGNVVLQNGNTVESADQWFQAMHLFRKLDDREFKLLQIQKKDSEQHSK